MIGHVDDFSALQQQLLDGKVVIRKIEAALQSNTEHDVPKVSIMIQINMTNCKKKFKMFHLSKE